VKKLGRIGRRGAGHRVTGNRRGQLKVSREGRQRRATGWEFVHVCIDDATRLAYVEVLADEKGATAAGFLRRAVAWFKGMGITVERVLSDNGSCYRSRLHARACAELGMRHLFTRPPSISTPPRSTGRWTTCSTRPPETHVVAAPAPLAEDLGSTSGIRLRTDRR
jgi:hypothetical protein